MKISEKQVWMLLEIAKNSLQIQDGGQVFVLTQEQRAKLVNEILNQLDNELIETGNIEENEEKLNELANDMITLKEQNLELLCRIKILEEQIEQFKQENTFLYSENRSLLYRIQMMQTLDADPNI